MISGQRRRARDTEGIDSPFQSQIQNPTFAAQARAAFSPRTPLSISLQWVFVPAVKDGSSEQFEGRRTALGQILERTVRSKISFSKSIEELRNEAFEKYKALLESYGKSLEDLANSLTTRLLDWAHHGARVLLSWQSDSSKVSISAYRTFVVASRSLDGSRVTA